jgi:hypothetical protein
VVGVFIGNRTRHGPKDLVNPVSQRRDGEVASRVDDGDLCSGSTLAQAVSVIHCLPKWSVESERPLVRGAVIAIQEGGRSRPLPVCTIADSLHPFNRNLDRAPEAP